MNRSLALSVAFTVACAALGVVACSGESDDKVAGDAPEVVDGMTVENAISQSCSTTVVKGLATQLIEEIQCLKPGSFKRIDKMSGLSLGAAVFPYLQTPAANAL